MERGLTGRRVLLVDPREGYGSDRTWCGWSVVAHPFDADVSHRWRRWRVRAPTGSWILRQAPGLHYHRLPSDAFYRRVLARLEPHPDVELRLGVGVSQVRPGLDHVEVETSAGVLRADLVFDSRPPDLPPEAEAGERVTLLQHFEGWTVRTERDAFDPSTVTLMDFAMPQDRGIHFLYVLPFGPRHALVEPTWFGTDRLAPEDYRGALVDAVEGRLGIRGYTVVDREAGSIPMTTRSFDRQPHPRLVRIGLAGGLAKPSTGYAFQRIQSDSATLAERLLAGGLPSAPEPRPRRAAFQDRVFLSYLARAPRQAPDALVDLFRYVPPTTLARFLSDIATLPEVLRVMRHMPPVALTLETLRSVPIWLRPRVALA